MTSLVNATYEGETPKVLDDFAAQVISSLTSIGAREFSVPERFHMRSEFGGSDAHLEPRALTGGPVTFARVTRLRAGPRAQVLNTVVFPKLGTTLPVLASEVLVFARGVHLFVCDYFDAGCPHPALADALEGERERLSKRWEMRELPEWGTLAFSKSAIFLKASRDHPIELEATLNTFETLVDAWVELALNPTIGLENTRQETRRAARNRFVEIQAKNEPAGPFLSRMAGEEWTHEFTHQFLYPEWLIGRDQPPDWMRGAGK